MSKAYQLDQPHYYQKAPVEQLMDIVEGVFRFEDQLEVSPHSRFGDSVWDWKDENHPRLNPIVDSALRISWKDLQTRYALSETLLQELKIYCFLRVYFSKQIFHRSRKLHPRTVVQEIYHFLAFLGKVIALYPLCASCPISSLSQISVQDLREATENCSEKDSIFKILKYLTVPFVVNNLPAKKLQWNEADIDFLSQKTTSSSTQSYELLPDELFRQLSDQATSDIHSFLSLYKMYGLDPVDQTPLSTEVAVFFEGPLHRDFELELYIYKASRNCVGGRRNLRQETKGAPIRAYEFQDALQLIHRVRNAAQVILLQYTGARPTEIRALQIGCLKQSGQHWYIHGTVFKNEPLNAPVGRDKWVAIPIVRDAVQVLEFIAGMNQTPHLFFNDYKSDNILTVAGFNNRLNAYLRSIDQAGKWSTENLNAYRFRHIVAYFLRKADLGYPFITRQLKHYVGRQPLGVSDVTLKYGCLGERAVQDAIDRANRDYLRDLYDPNSPVVGPGAEKFRHVRKEYFAGLVLQGFEEEEILQKLEKELGLPLANVGLGYCQGFAQLKNNTSQSPPCIGNLQCNPARCPNAVIPAHKQAFWEAFEAENRRRAHDPQFTHLKESFLQTADEAQQVVQLIQIEKKSKSQKD